MAALRLAPDPDRWWRPAALYLLGLVAVYLVGTAVGTLAAGEPTLTGIVSRPILFPVLFLYAPPAIAAVAALRGYSPVASLMLGVAVGLGFAALGVLAALFGTSGNGDSPLWALAGFYAGAGVVLAMAGHAIGLVARLAAERLRPPRDV